MANMKNSFDSMDTRKKATIGIFVVIILVILWQVMGMFGGSSSSTPTGPVISAPAAPRAVPIAPVAVSSPEEEQMVRLQQESQVRYITALNELQMLKVAQAMVETNSKIMKAKQDTVTAQKNILNMLEPPQQPARTATEANQTSQQVVTYTVVSVSQLQSKWGAVLSYASNLYSVHVGDVLPPDGSTVVSIDKSGVELERDNMRYKISMVSSI